MSSLFNFANGKIVQPSLKMFSFALVLLFSMFLALFAPHLTKSTYALTEEAKMLNYQTASINMYYFCANPTWSNGGLNWYISGSMDTSNLLNDWRVTTSFDSTTGFLHVTPDWSNFCSSGLIIDHFETYIDGVIAPDMDEFGNFYLYTSDVWYSGIYVTDSGVQRVSTNTYRDFDLRLITGLNTHLTCRDNLNICKVNIGVHYDPDNSSDYLNNYSFTISSFKRDSNEFDPAFNLSFYSYNDGVEIATGLKWGFATGYTPLIITSGSTSVDFYIKFSVSDDFVVGSGEAGSDTSSDFDAERQWIENIIYDTDEINASIDFSGIGLLNPFTGWFNMFISDNCTYIPTLASWFGTNQSRFCSPWSGTIRDVLTPVIATCSSFLLWLFCFKWLQNDFAVHGHGRTY